MTVAIESTRRHDNGDNSATDVSIALINFKFDL